MFDGSHRAVLLKVPFGGRLMQGRRFVRMLLPELHAEKFSKHAVIAPPGTVTMNRDQKQVLTLQSRQDVQTVRGVA